MPLAFLPSGGAGSAGGAPYGRGVVESNPLALGFYQALDEAETLRVNRYVESWRFYFGKHWKFSREDGEPFVTLNYYRKALDKLTEFLCGKGFVITVPESLEATTKSYLDEVWKYNKREALTGEIALSGSVTGDSFVMVTDEEPDALQQRINPYSQGRTKIHLLPSTNVFPTWDPLNVERILRVRIETIFHASKEVATPGTNRDEKGNYLSFKRFTQIIEPDRILEQYHGEMPVIRPNILGEIPIVHIKNMAVPHEFYGMSDGADLMDLNREINEKHTDISDTINYHSAPITVITGAKTKGLERGPKALWSGLPPEAKVYNLELGGDLTAAQSYLDRIKKGFHELSDVPENVLGGSRAISNTSGVAMHLEYQPILGRTKRKRTTYEPGFERINYFILRIGQLKGRVQAPFDLCSNCGGRILQYDDPTAPVEYVWNEDRENYDEVRRPVRKCFHIDKTTLDFMNPEKMRVKVWRQYGFGSEMVDVTMSEARTIVRGERSYWDYWEIPKDAQEKHDREVAAVRERNAQRRARAGQEGGSVEAEEPEPEQPKPQARPLPVGEAVTYEEPVEVRTITPLVHPRTQQLLRTIETKRFLVPTGCQAPRYLNPFENSVTFNDVLPKDEALQASLYEQYQRMQVVDREWIQARIPGVAEEMNNINRRMKANGPNPLAQQGTPGFLNHTASDLSPATRDLTAVPDQNGDPVKMGQ